MTAPAAASRRLTAAGWHVDWALAVSTGLLVATTVSWRRGVYYAGGVDPVVAAKALMSLVAVAIAIWIKRTSPLHRRLSSVSPWLLTLFLLASLFGAWSTGSGVTASVVDAVRQALIAITVFQLLQARPCMSVIRALVSWMAVIALLGAVTGIASAASGRLEGGIPPLVPNELTELCGVVAIALVWRASNGFASRIDYVWILVFAGIIWLTGSRTGLLTVVLGMLVVLVQARRLTIAFVLSLLSTLPVLAYALLATSALHKFADRGGSTNVGTLSNRTIAWEAALHLHHGFWSVAFGNGLAQVEIPVVAQYRTEQILDSSWVSALVQAGLVGLVVFAAWVIYVLVLTLRTTRRFRVLALGLLIFIVLRSFLESGLVGASPVFVMFFVFAVSGDVDPAEVGSSAVDLTDFRVAQVKGA